MVLMVDGSGSSGHGTVIAPGLCVALVPSVSRCAGGAGSKHWASGPVGYCACANKESQKNWGLADPEKNL